MASARKKQDEKNLKTLRELVSLPHNKYCFDCNQRGPTYVNVTIGSFVCTKCSGMLRGLTPPHRVKSISMATFTPEEVDLVQQRGNDHCRRTWLGLYEGQQFLESAARDEQKIHDLMVDKYERRRYYLETNGTTTTTTTTASSIATNQRVEPPQLVDHQKSAIGFNAEKGLHRKNAIRRPTGTTNHSLNLNNNITNSRSFCKGGEFVANFEQADIFQADDLKTASAKEIIGQVIAGQFQGFANFDDNPVFSNNTSSMPDLNHMNSQQKNNATMTTAPPEDRYLPLKDLDNALKTQTIIDWNSGSSNGSAYSASVTPSSSIYSSSSPQSMYGSPSQGQFATLFPSQDSTPTSNPFNSTGGSNAWTNTNGFSSNGGASNGFSSNSATNGFSNGTNGFSNGSNGFSNGTNGFSNGSNAFSNGSNGFSNGSNAFSNGSNGFSNGSNGFSNGSNGFSNGSNGFSSNGGGTNGFSGTNTANPFRPVDPFKANGFSQSFQPTFSNQFNGQQWAANPFTPQVATNGHSNNPFL